MKETIKEYPDIKPEFIENGMKLSRVREILNNLIAATIVLYENQPDSEVKELAGKIQKLEVDFAKLEARVAALEKPQQ